MCNDIIAGRAPSALFGCQLKKKHGGSFSSGSKNLFQFVQIKMLYIIKFYIIILIVTKYKLFFTIINVLYVYVFYKISRFVVNLFIIKKLYIILIYILLHNFVYSIL